MPNFEFKQPWRRADYCALHKRGFRSWFNSNWQVKKLSHENILIILKTSSKHRATNIGQVKTIEKLSVNGINLDSQSIAFIQFTS